MNLADGLIDLGEWDAAETELIQGLDADGLADIQYLACKRGWLAALRGDTVTAEALLAGMEDLRSSEAPQDQTTLALAEAFTAAAAGQPEDALRHARAVLTHAAVLGMSHGEVVWAWPLAARAAHELGDLGSIAELLALLDSYQPGHVVPVLRAERELVRARLAARDGQEAAAAAFAAGITRLRAQGTPYHLAHGLLDQADYLLCQGDAHAAELAIAEARTIGRQLGCQPLLNRADATEPAQTRLRA
jgi:hypothetical protein